MHESRLGRFIAVAVLVSSAAMSVPLAGAENASNPEPAQRTASPLMPDLEAFVDGVVGAYMVQEKISGAQVSVVRDGQTLLVKGYGIDSLEPARPVDPTRSLFRLGSISKTFTWIAIMQLAERGKLEITDPVNDHLPDELDVPDEGFQRAIRIVDLMNHTAGFEEVLQRLFVAEGSTLAPLDQHLRRYRPHRVREPGRFMAYSNYGAALAGAIVAQVSGMPFESYVEQNIFAPLGMTHTTFREKYEHVAGLPEPMSDELAVYKAQGIESREGIWRAYPDEHIVSMAPAGSAVSTAEDMARYMIALLDPAQLEQSNVLSSSTFEEMTRPTFQSAPGMPAMHHGFFNSPLGINTVLGFDNLSHGGGTLHFSTFMVVIPDLSEAPAITPPGEEEGAPSDEPGPTPAGGNLGIFVAANSSPGGTVAEVLPERILMKYFPGAATRDPAPPQDFAGRSGQYAGQYRSMRRSYTKFEKLLSLGAVLPVTTTADGYLTTSVAGEPVRLVEIGKDLFRKVDGDVTFAFLRNQAGEVTHIVAPGGSFERIDFFRSASWFFLMLAAGALTSIGIVAAAALRRRRVIAESIWERRSAQLMVVNAIAWLAALVLCAVWAVPMLGPDIADRFMLGYPQTSLKIALGVLLVAVGLTALAAMTLVPVWKDRNWSAWRRVRHSAAVLVLIALVLTLMDWNAVGLRYF